MIKLDPNDALMLYGMATMNIAMAMTVVLRGAKYLSEEYRIYGRDRSCFVMPVAWGLAYAVLKLEYALALDVHNIHSVTRGMAWGLLEFASLVYMANVMKINVQKRKRRIQQAIQEASHARH